EVEMLQRRPLLVLSAGASFWCAESSARPSSAVAEAVCVLARSVMRQAMQANAILDLLVRQCRLCLRLRNGNSHSRSPFIAATCSGCSARHCCHDGCVSL